MNKLAQNVVLQAILWAPKEAHITSLFHSSYSLSFKKRVLSALQDRPDYNTRVMNANITFLQGYSSRILQVYMWFPFPLFIIVKTRVPEMFAQILFLPWTPISFTLLLSWLSFFPQCYS